MFLFLMLNRKRNFIKHAVSQTNCKEFFPSSKGAFSKGQFISQKLKYLSEILEKFNCSCTEISFFFDFHLNFLKLIFSPLQIPKTAIFVTRNNLDNCTSIHERYRNGKFLKKYHIKIQTISHINKNAFPLIRNKILCHSISMEIFRLPKHFVMESP